MTDRTGDVSAAEFNASQAAINELMQLVAKQDAELTALKGRRCDGCANWRRWANDSQHGDCTLLSAATPTAAAVFCAEWDGEPLLASVQAELDALKARSCYGCKWYEPDTDGLSGWCGSWAEVGPDFACNRWESR